MTDETKPGRPGEIKVHDPVCPDQKRKTPILHQEFLHTRKRLARMKIAPLVQFCVFAYNCDDKSHERKDTYHVDYSTMGSDVPLEGGLQASIAAVEALLTALKAKLQ